MELHLIRVQYVLELFVPAGGESPTGPGNCILILDSGRIGAHAASCQPLRRHGQTEITPD